MNESDSEPQGFRSRDNQLKKRIEERKKIFAEFQKGSHRREDETKEVKYIGLSHSLVKHKVESEGEEIDMFAGDLEIVHNQEEKKGEVTDEQGYYHVYNGKVVAERYKIIDKIGRGVFGVVAKVEDQKEEGKILALKILRKNQATVASGQREYSILSKMKKCENIMKIYDYFHEDGHLFLVCELLGADLRTYTRKNQDKIALQHIRQYAISMFLSLHELRKHKIIHADIKPDNFLMDLSLKNIKLADFGTSFSLEEHSTDIEYLVARYYRAPEIILGCETPPEQRYGIDTWAVGCSLFEIFTGKFLFDGNSNNEMLKLMQETKGKFSIKMLKKCKFFEKHFDSEFNFLYTYYDKNTKETVVSKMQVGIAPQRELLGMLKRYSRFDQDPKILNNFRDFIENCLTLNPKTRLTPQTAFQHPFLNYQIKLK